MLQTGYIINGTSKYLVFKVWTTATGALKSDMDSSQAGLAAKYWKSGANAPVSITLSDKATTDPFSSGAIVNLGLGVYALCVPDAARATTAGDFSVVYLAATDLEISVMSEDHYGSEPRAAAGLPEDALDGLLVDHADAGSAGLALASILGFGAPPTGAANAAALFAKTFDGTKMAGLTVQELLAIMFLSVVAKLDGANTGATGTAHVRNLADAANAITWTFDANGNRTGVTLTLTAVR